MNSTIMSKEIASIPDILDSQIQKLIIPEELSTTYPRFILTTARGTSDFATEYLGYLIMQQSGIPVISVPLSLNTTYNSPWKIDNALVLAISQSGASPDLVKNIKQFQKFGAKSIALVNTTPSPLSEISNNAINILAGEEKSVAATKSFITSLTAGINTFSHLIGSDEASINSLLSKLKSLPKKLRAAQKLDWSKAINMLKNCEDLLVIGRGAGLAIAKEAALKFKETCLIHAEALSGAEVKHGPMALVNSKKVVLILAPPDKTQKDLIDLADFFRGLGAKVLLAADESVASRDLTLIDAEHSALQGITTIYSFYQMVEWLSVIRGIDTDSPPNLNKATLTF